VQAAQLELQLDQVLAVHQGLDQIVAGTGAVAVHHRLDQTMFFQQLDDMPQIIFELVLGIPRRSGRIHRGRHPVP